MAGISQKSMMSLRDIASMAYDTEGGTGAQGGEGRIGMIGGRVVKYNTHRSERLFGTWKSQEMIDGANAVRDELLRIATEKYKGQDTINAVKSWLGWKGKDKPTSLLDRKIVAQVVTWLLDNEENWEKKFGEAGLHLNAVNSDRHMDFSVQKLRVMREATGFRDLTHQGMCLIAEKIGEPRPQFCALLKNAASFSASSACTVLYENERQVLAMLMQDPDFYGANPSNEDNRKALLRLARDVPFVSELKKRNYPWSEALSSERIPLADRKSVLQLLGFLRAGFEDIENGELSKCSNVMTAFVAMLPNGIKRAREIQPKGEIKFETWWEALRLDSIEDCPSMDDGEIGKKFLNAVFRRIVTDVRRTGLLSEQDELELQAHPWDNATSYPQKFSDFLMFGQSVTYEACLRHLKHPRLAMDESEQYNLTPFLGQTLTTANLLDSFKIGLQEPRQEGTIFKYGETVYVNGSGADPDEFLDGGLRATFTEKQLCAMLRAIQTYETHIPAIYGGTVCEKSLQVEITKANENGDMRVIYKIPLVRGGGLPQESKMVIHHEVVFKPDGSAKFVSLKCVDRNPVSPETLEKISDRLNLVSEKRYDDSRDNVLSQACRDIMKIYAQVYAQVGDVKDDDSSTYVDRLKLGVDEDVRELMEFLSTKPLDDAQLDEWSEDDVKELKALYEIMKKRWEITLEASKVNADQSYLDRCEDELVDLRRAYENLEGDYKVDSNN